MFGLKKLQRKVVSTFTPTPTVEEIHQAFDTAGEKALLEAKSLLAKITNEAKSENIELLKKLGFKNAALVTQQSDVNKTITENQFKVKTVEYYIQKYPQYKFIFIDQVEELCKKYGLLCAQVGMYKGNVPTKNLKEIEAFKASDDDKYLTNSSGFVDRLQFDLKKGRFISRSEFDKEAKNESTIYNRPRADFMTSEGYDLYMMQLQHASSRSHYNNYNYTEVPLFICAPKNDINIGPHDRVEGVFAGHEIKDPIVLHFVKSGFLVVSKWGIEGEDPILLNEKMN